MTETATARGPGLATVAPLRRGRWRWWIAAVVLAAVVGTGIGVWRWQQGLSVFPSGGNGEGGPLPIRQTVYSLALGWTAQRAPVSVDLRSVTAHVVKNTANATVDVLQCRRRSSVEVFGDTTHLGWCRDIRPFAPGPHTFGGKPGNTALVLAITAYQGGVVRIAGLDVTYQAGWREGAQNTGMRMYYRTTMRPH